MKGGRKFTQLVYTVYAAMSGEKEHFGDKEPGPNLEKRRGHCGENP